MNPTENPTKPDRHIDPFVVGTLCGVVAAIVYSAANISLRAVAHLDPFWVSWVKSLPTTAMTLPWIFLRWGGRKKHFPNRNAVLVLIGAGLFGQMVGNVGFQYALGVIGLAISVPITLGTMIVLGAVMGRLFLSEPVSRWTALSIVILLVSITVLSLGASGASESIRESLQDSSQHGPWFVISGVAAASVCGLAYAILGVAIRFASQQGMPVSSTLLVVSLCGVIPLALISWQRLGMEVFFSTSTHEWQLMIAGGLFNAIAFLALTKAFSLTSVVHVNAINASQTAMAGIAGLFLFGEQASVALGVGIAMTILGLLLLRAAPRAISGDP